VSTRFVFVLFLLAFGIAVSACGSGGSGITPPKQMPSSAIPIATVAPVGTSAIVFASDRSLVFSAIGQTAQLSASGPGGPATFASTNAAVATVTAGGLVTAVAVGATTIVASSGDAHDVATVSIGQVAPGAVLVPSSAIQSVTGSQVTVLSSAVAGVKVGSLIVSGDKGGLMGSVTAMQGQGQTVTLSYNPITLAQAFPNAKVDITGVADKATLTITRGHASVRYRDGSEQVVSCTTTSGTSTVSSIGLTLTRSVNIVPHFVFQTDGGTVQTFGLSAIVDAAVTAGLDNVSFAASASATFTCSTTLTKATLKSIWYGPLVLSLTGTLEYGVGGSAAVSANVVLPALSYTYAVHAEGGINYSAGQWSSVATGTPTGTFTLDPTGANIGGNVTVSFGPYLAYHLGVDASLGHVVDLASLQLLTPKVYETFDLSVTGGTDITQLAYSGPVWDGKLGLDISFDPSLGGNAASLLKRLGVPTTFGTFSAFNPELKIIGSPAINTKVSVDNSACSASFVMNEVDNNPIALNYNNDRVSFEALGGPGSPKIVATAIASGTDIAGAVASSSWSATPADDGSYSIVSLLYDGVFGALHLPYASPPQRAVIACNANPTPAPSPSASAAISIVDNSSGELLKLVSLNAQPDHSEDDIYCVDTADSAPALRSVTLTFNPAPIPNPMGIYVTDAFVIRNALGTNTTINGVAGIESGNPGDNDFFWQFSSLPSATEPMYSKTYQIADSGLKPDSAFEYLEATRSNFGGPTLSADVVNCIEFQPGDVGRSKTHR